MDKESIKKALECCANVKEKCDNKKCYLFDKLEHPYCERQLKKDLLTLINELESENEKLKQHKRELEGGQRDLLKAIKEFDKENQQLKDRIAELEKEKEEITKTWVKDREGVFWGGVREGELKGYKQLKQFAERLKEKLFDLGNIVSENDIDETLKEFL